MAYIDTRKTIIDTWVKEEVAASPAMDVEVVCVALKAMLPHDGRGVLVEHRIERRHVEEALSRLRASKPSLFFQAPPTNPFEGRDRNELSPEERMYAAALSARRLGLVP